MQSFSHKQIRELTEQLEKSDDFVLLDSARTDQENKASYLFTNPEKYYVCRSGDNAGDFLAELEHERRKGKYLAGWFAYEFGYLLEPGLCSFLQPQQKSPKGGILAVFGVFEKPQVYKHGNPFVEGLLRECQDDEAKCVLSHITPSMQKKDYLQAVARIKNYIEAGDTYQVNYTLKLLFEFSGSVASLYRQLRRNQHVGYGAWIRAGNKDILSFSPELFFRADGSQVRVRPMKGTMARGRTLQEDKKRQKQLHADVKNRAENVMIVDLLRNDLGCLMYRAGGGRVVTRSLFDVEPFETVLQMTSTVDAIPTKNCAAMDLRLLVSSLFPCGSVTGAPKIRTMQIIHELEKGPRGVYCGAIGYAGPKDAVFNVPIRTIALTGDKGEMGIGSGIVYDSDPEKEWEESLLKGKFLSHARPAFALIETILWQRGVGYLLFEEHMQRLNASANYFLFSFDQKALRRLLIDNEKSFQDAHQRVRILLHRDGGLEFSATALPNDHQLIDDPAACRNVLGTVVVSPHKSDPNDPLYYHKTTLRSKYEQERKKALSKGHVEVLFSNTRSEITEGSISNVFILQDGVLYTPPCNCGLLNGTFRSYLLSAFPHRVQEKVLYMDDLLSADAIFIGNSVRGLCKVALGAAAGNSPGT